MIIPNYEDYEIFEDGTIISNKHQRSRMLKVRLSHDGYGRVALSKNGKRKDFFIHRLVIECFGSDKRKDTVNHKDGNKLNNHIDNLEWATKEENMQHAYLNGLKKPMSGTIHSKSLLTEEEVMYIRDNYRPHSKEFGMIALSEKFNVSISTINRCIGRRSYKNV